jgi:hypothetical protein
MQQPMYTKIDKTLKKQIEEYFEEAQMIVCVCDLMILSSAKVIQQ